MVIATGLIMARIAWPEATAIEPTGSSESVASTLPPTTAGICMPTARSSSVTSVCGSRPAERTMWREIVRHWMPGMWPSFLPLRSAKVLIVLPFFTIRPSLIRLTLIPPPCSPKTLKVPGNFDSASMAMPAAAPGGPKSARFATSASMIWFGASSFCETISMHAFSNSFSSSAT